MMHNNAVYVQKLNLSTPSTSKATTSTCVSESSRSTPYAAASTTSTGSTHVQHMDNMLWWTRRYKSDTLVPLIRNRPTTILPSGFCEMNGKKEQKEFE
ncbi:hypothetical protein Vi05172_g3590 [Venturia inaequalis]|nr:hypothetical protein Vi05172_g3590 [Venturia inaequalis]